MKTKHIVHFWEVPHKNYISLKKEFLDKFTTKLWKYSQNKVKSLTGVTNSVVGRIRRKERKTIRIDQILKLNKLTKFNLEEIEQNIIWMGAPNSQGIINPKLPFNFNSRQGARFLVAIYNEGWISDGAYYSNLSQELRNSVKKDTLFIFGGNENTIKEWVKEKDQYLAFPSIIRDVLNIVTNFKGKKSENNPSIPSFILQNKELMLGWIEQTIADEGCVKYYPNTYRREITWKRSIDISNLLLKNIPIKGIGIRKLPKDIQRKINKQKCKVIEDEVKILNRLGIFYTLYNLELYSTKDNKTKARWQIRLPRKNNLKRINKLIKIPEPRKDILMKQIAQSY